MSGGQYKGWEGYYIEVCSPIYAEKKTVSRRPANFLSERKDKPQISLWTSHTGGLQAHSLHSGWFVRRTHKTQKLLYSGPIEANKPSSIKTTQQNITKTQISSPRASEGPVLKTDLSWECSGFKHPSLLS